MDTDIVVSYAGSLWQFKPMNDAAYQALTDNVATEGWQWLGRTLCVDWRFGRGLIDFLESLGLTVTEA